MIPLQIHRQEGDQGSYRLDHEQSEIANYQLNYLLVLQLNPIFTFLLIH